eukprot:TRINITY_DN44838_c0_g1_i1.p1 TRINITY_DN44838_c0_g1~~TRINITY_DN44838_c0_g1_i1.p1  ORF type:complete len:105 (+),score=13.53 TRINITY_DN44838_c0_g1_i1:50-364(+)
MIRRLAKCRGPCCTCTPHTDKHQPGSARRALNDAGTAKKGGSRRQPLSVGSPSSCILRGRHVQPISPGPFWWQRATSEDSAVVPKGTSAAAVCFEEPLVVRSRT